MYVLDTNVVSELMKGTVRVIARLALTDRTEVAVPGPALAEIAYGIARLPASKRRQQLQARFDLIGAEIARAEWSDDVSRAYGTIKASLERRGLRIEDFDAAIAAHAVAAGATLVTANVSHMVRIPGLQVEDWTVRRRSGGCRTHVRIPVCPAGRGDFAMVRS
jgi:tRNA(fMet)-specific endonuclease VapC